MSRARKPSRRVRRLSCELLESRLLLSASTPATAIPLAPLGQADLTGALSPAAPVTYYRADVVSGLLDAHLTSATRGLTLSLFAQDGTKLLDSIGVPADGTDARITQHVSGTVFVAVEGDVDARFDLTVTTESSFDPRAPLPMDLQLLDLATGDFDGDGHADVAWLGTDTNGQTTLLIYQGLGDGSFREGGRLTLGFTGYKLLAGTFDRTGGMQLLVVGYAGDSTDGSGDRLDLVTWSASDGFVSTDESALLPGAPQPFSSFLSTFPVAVCPTGDGTDEAIMAGQRGVFVLKGDGHGSLTQTQLSDLPVDPSSLRVGDFNGDGHADLILASISDETPGTFFFAGRNGGFAAPVLTDVPVNTEHVVADFNGDGRDDLALIDPSSFELSILSLRPDGSWAATDAGVKCYSVLLTDDFTGDGRPDLLATTGTSSVSVMAGNGDGTFESVAEVPVAGFDDVRSCDFNGDGRPDLIGYQNGTSLGPPAAVPLLLGTGDGRFEGLSGAQTVRAGTFVADFNLDGWPDTLTQGFGVGSGGSLQGQVLLGAGDGSFEAVPFDLGASVTVVAVADVNRDGRPDLIALPTDPSLAGRELYVAAGNGDGTFQPPITLPLFDPDEPVPSDNLTVLTGDVNGDGLPDIVVVSSGTPLNFDLSSGTVTGPGPVTSLVLLLGTQDGGFRRVRQDINGLITDKAALGNLDADGHDELVTLSDSGELSVWRLDEFADPKRLASRQVDVVAFDAALLVADLDGQPGDEVIVQGEHIDSEESPPATSVPVPTDGGPFTTVLFPPGPILHSHEILDVFSGLALTQTIDQSFAEGVGPGATPQLQVADVDGDGRNDLLWVGQGINVQGVAALLNRGDHFEYHDTGLGQLTSIVPIDFNADGRLDLVVSTDGVHQELLAGTGDGSFVPVDSSVAITPHATPLVADLNHDGIDDVTVVAGDGRILFRRGLSDGTYAPPIVLNVANGPALDAAVLNGPDGPVLYALARKNSGHVGYYYDFDAQSGKFVPRLDPINAGVLPADLIAFGQDGLISLDALRGTADLNPPSEEADPFAPLTVAAMGAAPTAGIVADVNGDGVPDLIVADQYSGNVSVLLGGSGVVQQFRSNDGLASMGESGSLTARRALDQPTALAAADVDGDGNLDLVVLHAAAGFVQVLRGRGDGSFYDPEPADRFEVPVGSTAVVVGTMADGKHQWIAVLDHDGGQVLVYVQRGGRWVQKDAIAAGTKPTGMSLQRVVEDGIVSYDLLVGNAFGDVLRLVGNGDGTFQASRRLVGRIALAVGDLNGDGIDDFVYADEALDRVTVQSGKPGTTEPLDVKTGLVAPGAVRLADLNGDGIDDLIVCNTGGNSVLVYLGLGHGKFGPEINGGQGISTGTAPADVAVGMLGDGQDGDHLPDLIVANEGSNDVTVLYGDMSDGSYHLRVGPRLKAGRGPDGVLIADLDGNGVPDLIVTNRADGTVSILPGVGQGLFDDRSPRVLQVGQSPGSSILGDFDGDGKTDLVSLDAGSNTLTFYSDVGSANPTMRTIASGGLGPIAAVARHVNGDGITDLIVANYDDGHAALFTGGTDGPKLLEVMDVPGHPTAMAGDPTDRWSVYVAGEGAESASLLHFADPAATPAGPPPAAPVPTEDPTFPLLPDQSSPPSSPVPERPAVVELQPLTATTVDLVPAVTAGEAAQARTEEEAATVPAGGAVKAAPLGRPADAPPAGQPPLAGDEPPGALEQHEERPASSGGSDRYLLGLDEVKPPRINTGGSSDAAPQLVPPDQVPPAERPQVARPEVPIVASAAREEAPAVWQEEEPVEARQEQVIEEAPAPRSRPWGGVVLVLAAWGLAWDWHRRREGPRNPDAMGHG